MQELKDLPHEVDSLSVFADKLDDLIHDYGVMLQNLFKTEVLVDEGKRSIRIHILQSDANGRPQTSRLVQQLGNAVLDYCIPRRQIESALEYRAQTNSFSRISALHKEARSLFTDISNSGEGGELLLFILAENVLNYPQALSKMALKTSSRMHFHGLDGIHISCTGDSARLRLHFGESKLLNSAKMSIKEASKSIASMLNDSAFTGSARRDFYLLNTQVDLGDNNLEEALKGFLDPSDPRFLAPEVCALLLAGHELSNYPIISKNSPVPKKILNESKGLAEVLEENAKKHKIDHFHIDLFLVPFPNIQAFRDALIKELGI